MAASTLATSQREFLAHLLDDERALPKDWGPRHAAGMAVYRNAYRTRLVNSLRSTYERTARWLGEDAFRQAAAHHFITHVPRSWTLDGAGEGFAETLAELFAGDPEVAELAWLEWAMHRCFIAEDADPLDAVGFTEAAASFEEQDWATMRLRFLPGTHQTEVSHDIAKLWLELGQDRQPSDFSCSKPLHCVVWREGLKPVFTQVDANEGQVLGMLLGGASYGDACNTLVDLLGEENAVTQAGAMLGHWIQLGMLAGITKRNI